MIRSVRVHLFCFWQNFYVTCLLKCTAILLSLPHKKKRKKKEKKKKKRKKEKKNE
jgi:hypothetical protein